jgi:hypothetical protein
MSDTPETDAAWDKYISPPYTYWAGDLRILAQRLERERDEARHKLKLCMAANSDVARIAKERNEALDQVKELIYIAERAIALAEIDFENDKFGVVSELRDGVERIKEGAK